MMQEQTAPKAGSKRRTKVSVVIPAYNEEKTLGAVLDVLHQVELIDDILVVSDGSTDGTVQVAKEHRARVLELQPNRGKGGAMQAGVKATFADVVLFLDADLMGLKPEHVRDLLRPVLQGEVDMSVGVFDGGRPITDLSQAMAPYLSGQRAVRRHVLESLFDLDLSRFGAEVALTRFFKRRGARWAEVALTDMTHVMKEEKLGLVKGFVARMKMYWEIAKYLPKD
ncbi:MAG: glycosyltransferase family 2 protein [Thermaerobacter sp.]|jgi:glycosyltransferase involved in cell wall biosynthesis|nr:glycosyltransferase family 2 protein [Thermaerobacter sp.]